MPVKVPTLTKSKAVSTLREKGYYFTGLLTPPDQNMKVQKNIAQGVLTSPLHLAPADLSGYEVCPFRSKECTRACLHTSGNPAHQSVKDVSRISRTQAYFKDRDLFLSLLIAEIKKLKASAVDLGMKCGLRLNATSDIPWERVAFTYEDVLYKNLMQMFPDIQFYDYTKRPIRKNLPSNYHLTFSLSEDNDHYAIAAMNSGMNVAVVMNVGRTKPLPATFRLGTKDYPVADGDEHDYRPADPPGYIIGLRAKGLARQDKSVDEGFVRDVSLHV